MNKEKNQYIIELEKEFEFEGKKYSKIDMSKLDELTTEDILQIEKMYTAEGNIIITTSDMTLEYAILTAIKTTNLPKEFFLKLPPKEAKKICRVVTNFFYKEN